MKGLSVASEEPPKDVLSQAALPKDAPLQDMESGKPEPEDIAAIDVKLGCSYCMDDKEFYCDMLSTYIEESEKKKKELAAALESGDIKAYTVTVHDLKSTSKTIGAEAFSDMALKLELAGKDGRLEDIKAGHDSLMKAYDAVMEEAQKIIEDLKLP